MTGRCKKCNGELTTGMTCLACGYTPMDDVFDITIKSPEIREAEKQVSLSAGLSLPLTLQEKMDRLNELNRQIDEAEKKGGVLDREERNSLLKLYEEWRKLDKEVWAR